MMKIGSTVKLKSAPILMTVIGFLKENKVVDCTWFDANLHQTFGQFPIECLIDLHEKQEKSFYEIPNPR